MISMHRIRAALCELIGHQWGKREALSEHRMVGRRLVSGVLNGQFRQTCGRCGAYRTVLAPLENFNCQCSEVLIEEPVTSDYRSLLRKLIHHLYAGEPLVCIPTDNAAEFIAAWINTEGSDEFTADERAELIRLAGEHDDA